MELLIVRHGPAGNAAEKAAWKRSRRPDSERPLTKDGRRKTRDAARGLAGFVEKVDLIATSPWSRAAQTAELLAEALGAKAVEWPELVPDRDFEDLLARLRTLSVRRAALVGHEPHLSRFVSWLMTGRDHSILRLKKSQALLLGFKTPAAGAAELVWSLPPRQLRALA